MEGCKLQIGLQIKIRTDQERRKNGHEERNIGKGAV